MINNYWGFIKDPLYGYIKISELEREIIDTKAVQRLRRIRQLSGAEYVYPAANHTRFEHVIGCLHLAGLMWENLPVKKDTKDWQELRIAALLHDLGHGPFSHVFDPILIKYLKKTHEDLTSWLIKYSNIGELIELNGYNKDVLSRLAIGRSQKKDNFFKNQIISGTVDVDKLDFISRDSYHTGAGYGYIDIFRLIYTMGLHNNKLVVNSTALSTLETFLLARLESFKTIYFHKASRAVQIMLVRALEAYLKENNILNFKNPDDYLNLDDYNMWNLLKTNKTTKQIIDNIEQRKLFKCAYEITLYTKDRLVSSIFTNESVRKRIEEEIAAKAKINIREVIIDVPSLPSVPYSNLSSDPMEIPILFEEDSKKEIKSVGELSQIVNVLKVYMNIVRVYTQNEHREQVRKASENILGSLPSETKISY